MPPENFSRPSPQYHVHTCKHDLIPTLSQPKHQIHSGFSAHFTFFNSILRSGVRFVSHLHINGFPAKRPQARQFFCQFCPVQNLTLKIDIHPWSNGQDVGCKPTVGEFNPRRRHHLILSSEEIVAHDQATKPDVDLTSPVLLKSIAAHDQVTC